MKTLLIAGILSLKYAAFAAPFLVSDDYVPQSDPNLNPTQFILTGLAATPTTINATTRSTGNIVLEYDLANLANGKYTVTAAAQNIFGGVSVESAPFIFTKGVPGTPTNLRIVPSMLQ
jgi:hypothetical protein